LNDWASREMTMSYVILYTLLAIGTFYVLSRFVLSKYSWTNQRAIHFFARKNIPLKLVDKIIDGHQLHYAIVDAGNLPSLVFIHGSPGGWHRFNMFLSDPDLAGRFRMISIDRPGFGHSEFGHPMHLQDQCKILLTLIRELKTEQPMFLMGHSYGGPVVAKLAADDSHLFRMVIIAAGAIDPMLEKKEILRHLIEIKPLCWFIPGAHKPSNTELLYLKKDLFPLAGELERITCPVAFIHGDRDKVVPVENVAYGK